MPQVITQAVLQDIDLAVTTAFNQQFAGVETVYQRFAYVASSTGKGEVYPRLEQLPGIREWIGDRVVNSLAYQTFEIDNKTYEETLSVKREDVEDDRFGILTPKAQFLGQDAAEFPDRLVATLLANGTTSVWYDGVPFFSANHPDYTNTGAPTVSTNLITPTGGDTAGPTWYVVDTRQVLKGIIFQSRRPFRITPRIALDDPYVFDKNQFVWGVDGRCAAGFGIWQTICAVTAPLNGKYYQLARNAMTSHFRPSGAPLNIKPTLIMFPSPLKAAATTLMKGVYEDPSLNTGTASQSNPFLDDAEMLENLWLNT